MDFFETITTPSKGLRMSHTDFAGKDLLNTFREVCSGKCVLYLSVSPFLRGVGKQSKCKRSHLGVVYYSTDTLEYRKFLPVVYLIFFCVPSSGHWLLDSTFITV